MLTPTQLIYDAYQRTPKPLLLPNGKTTEYPEPEYVDVPDAMCWLCGAATHGRGRLRKDMIRKTFTNSPDARVPGSNSLCVPCSWILDQKFLRNHSLLVLDGRFEHPARDRIRDLLVSPPITYPWLLSIAISGQIHLSFLSHVNLSSRDIRVLVERVMTPIPAEGIGAVLEPVEILYSGGFSKDEIKTGQYRQDRIRSFGLARWREQEERISLVRGSRIFDLAIWAAQKGEEEPSSTDSTPRMNMPQQQRSSSTQFTGAGTRNDSKSHRTFGASSNDPSDPQQSAQQLSLFG